MYSKQVKIRKASRLLGIGLLSSHAISYMFSRHVSWEIRIYYVLPIF